MSEQITVADAKSYLGDFVDSKSLEGMPDADVLSMHGRISTAVSKHTSKPDPNKPWFDGFQDPGVKDWVKSMGNAYPNPESIALKAWNLEKFMGAEKTGRGVIMPKADAKPEEWNAFFKKTGLVPDKVDGYKIPDTVKDDKMMLALREHAYKMGVPGPVFDSITGFIMTQAQGKAEDFQKEFDVKADKEMTELRTEWGASYDANAELGQRAASSFIPHKDKAELEEILTRMEAVMGTKFTMQLFSSIGKGITEHAFVMGDTIQGDGSMTPEAARNRITTLKNDRAYAQKLLAGDADTRAEWDKLNRIAAGGGV